VASTSTLTDKLFTVKRKKGPTAGAFLSGIHMLVPPN